LVYLIFTAVVLGSKGQETPKLATLALGKVFVVLGMLTMFTAYLSLSIALIDTFRLDFKVRKFRAWLCTILIPLIAFVVLEALNKASFTKVLGIGGVISGGLTALIILVMVKRAKVYGDRKPEYEIPYSNILTLALAVLLIVGAVVEIINIF
jgi:hypothetical protein